MQRWNMSAGKDGYAIVLEDVKFWAYALETGFERLCDLSGGRLGGHNLGDWAWKVPVGRSKWDLSEPDDPWLINSLAGRLADLENWTFNVGWKRGTKTYPSIPLTHDQATAIHPDFVTEIDDIFGDDEK